MNILHLQPDLKLTSGVTRVIFQLMKNASPDAVHYAASFDGDAFEEFKEEQLNLIQLKVPGNKLFAPVHLLQIIFLCIKYRVSLIHAHHRYFDILGRLAGILLRIPVLTMVHSKVYSGRKISYKANHFVVPGENIRKHLSVHFGVPKNKITVINNFVDPSDYKTPTVAELQNLRTELGITAEMTVVTFIGRFNREKGVDILLHAFKRLEREYPNLILLCIGEGEMLHSLQDYSESLHRIRFIKPQTAIARYFYLSEIIVLPSRVDPFPLVMIEAGLLKKALLGTNVDGIAEFIRHDVDGFLVDCTKEALHDGLKVLLNDTSLRERLADAAHSKVMQEYLVGSQMQKYYKLYNQMVGKDE
jgi:glycosyltransferase involved in cell wall biosynthesis